MDKRCLKHDLDITVDTWKYLFYFKLSQNIFVPWVYVKIKQCACSNLRPPVKRRQGSHPREMAKVPKEKENKGVHRDSERQLHFDTKFEHEEMVLVA